MLDVASDQDTWYLFEILGGLNQLSLFSWSLRAQSFQKLPLQTVIQ